MQINRSLTAKFFFGLLLITWGAALLIFGPFYTRGYPIPRPIGIFFIAIGIYYFFLIHRYKNGRHGSKAKNEKFSAK